LSNSHSIYSAQALEEFATGVFVGIGAPLDIAESVSKSLVLSNLVGHDSHGVIRLLEYSGWVESGALIPAARPVISWSKEATTLIDGAWGWGQTASYLATEKVIESAKEFGTASVVLSRTNHVGRLGEYVDLMAQQGLMGIAFCNTGGPIVAPWGGVKGVLGTNPFAWGVPGADAFNYVLDFSTAVMAAGKIILAGMSGEKIEPGALIDKNGQPSTNPQDFHDGGSLIAFGGHKGSGLSALIDVAAGILSGNMPAAISNSGFGNGTVFIALDISRFIDVGSFSLIAQQFGSIFHGSAATIGGRVYLPGELEHEVKSKRSLEGIAIDSEVLVSLKTVGSRYGMQAPNVSEKLQ
jgi:LDH2 family malate/lactate/ureidoglycolate dehydrogenase